MGHQGSILRPVAARQPSIRWGRYWIFFSLRLMMRTRAAWSARHSGDADPAGAARGPGAASGRSQPLACLVLDADVGAQVARRAFISGHTWSFHTATASSSRSIAWRTGTWADQPSRRISFEVPSIV